MKVDITKTLLSVAICVLLGYMCYLIAPHASNQHIISWIVCSISMVLALVPAMGLQFPGNENRAFSAKVFLWVASAVLLITNVVFAFFEYNVGTLILVVGLELAISAYIAYSIMKK